MSTTYTGIHLLENGENGEPRFSELASSIRRNTDSICRMSVSSDYVSYSLENCSYLMVNLHNRDVKGFSTIYEYDDYLYIDVICNSPGDTYHNMVTRTSNPDIKTGKHMINAVIELAKSRGKGFVRLSALMDVISYYHYLGFTFMLESKKGDRRGFIKRDVQSLNTALKKLKENEKIIEKKLEVDFLTRYEEIEHDKIAADANDKLYKVIKNYPGFYSEKKQAEIATLKGVERIADIPENGVPMIYTIPMSRSRSRSPARSRSNGRARRSTARGGYRINTKSRTRRRR